MTAHKILFRLLCMLLNDLRPLLIKFHGKDRLHQYEEQLAQYKKEIEP